MKQAFRAQSEEVDRGDRLLPGERRVRKAARLVTKKAITPSEKEKAGNTRSRSAKLRVMDIRTPLGLVEEDDGTFTLFYTGFRRPAAGEPSKGWNTYRNVGLLKVRLTVNEE